MTTLYWIISGILAIIPVGIWLYILFKDTRHGKGILALMFSGGILAVLIVFGLQFFWLYFPEIDPFLWLETNITDPTYYFVILFVLVGVLEEIVKQVMVRFVDTRTILVQTVNDSIKFSLAAALGFAFAENIVYFYSVITEAAIQDVIVTFLFRSIFTACAHMIFSGIFGYFFGIAKFTLDITRHRHWQGKIYIGVHLMSKLFKIPYAQAFKEYKILQGLVIAILLHAVFNYMLQMNYILPVIGLVVLGYLYLRYLLHRKAGNLILVTDIDEKKQSSMGKKDEDIVLELIGMWFEQKKFVDVMHICERLLERDPDNNVVKLFKAKAMDKLDPNNPYRKILDTVVGKKRSNKDVNTIHHYRQKKEVEEKNVSEKKKEKMFRFIEEKKEKQDEIYKLGKINK
ncbi:PrsW family glutamic-type intramembrane protease [Patescibacteria group bacterium]